MPLGLSNQLASSWGQRNTPQEYYTPVSGATAVTLDVNRLHLILDSSAVGGTCTLTLPPAANVEIGTLATFYVAESTRDFVIASSAADLVALSLPNLTAVADYAVLVSAGIKWAVVEEVTT